MTPTRRDLLKGSAAAAAALAAAGLGATAPHTAPPTAPPTALPTAPPTALPTVELPDELMPPAAPREWRAAWVASVAQIDWPSRPGQDAQALREQVQQQVARAQVIGLNALILQVRPAADALYRSELEPPSEYLHANGQPGPAFDALQVWLDACREHGMELHAWFNPYRARHPSARAPLHEQHVARRQPEWVLRYGEHLWMDPGNPQAREHTLAVVADVLRRYDIDGVHMDDYFYPYPIKGADGRDLPFPDDASFSRWRTSGGTSGATSGGPSGLAAWRRDNVNRLVAELHGLVHRVRPTALFSISPFGIGRPDRRPPGIAGFSQYDQLHADVELWCEEGWFDALLPQLYWPRSRPQQSFEALLDYWLSVNPHGRHVRPGLFTSSVANGTPAAWSAEEVLWQIDRQRERQHERQHAHPTNRHGADGHAHFSLIALLQNRGGIAAELARTRYAEPALPPPTPWLGDGPPPSAVQLSVDAAGRAQLRCEDGRAAARWAVWRKGPGASSSGWTLQVLPGHADAVAPPKRGEHLVAQAFDRTGREGPRRSWVFPA